MTTVLTIADYPDIRTIISATLIDISDSDLNSACIVPIVNVAFLAKVPDFSVLIDPDKSLIKSAAAYYAAALTSPIFLIRTGRKYKLGDYEEQDSTTDWVKLSDWYMQLARRFLLTSSIYKPIFRRNLFTSTGVTSSGSNVPYDFTQWFSRIRPRVFSWALTGGLNALDWQTSL